MKNNICSIYDFKKMAGKTPIVIFGAGGFLDDMMEYMAWFFDNLSIMYIVDNAYDDYREGKIICGVTYEIKNPQILQNLNEDFIILIMNFKSTFDIYEQIKAMKLSDNATCYSYTEMLSLSTGTGAPSTNDSVNKIEKTIHSFWFSGEDKPDDYKRCIDSWYKKCPDFEIKEWDLNTYKTGNSFFNGAVKERKWAFASDYARVDTIYRFGGIYLDMDVEIVKDYSELLSCNSFFSFDTIGLIDLGAGFGSIKGNPLVGKLKDIYENRPFTTQDSQPELAQPRIIRKVFAEYGLKLDGNYEEKEGNRFYPRSFFAPEDCYTYADQLKKGVEYSVHHYLSGWRPSEFRLNCMDQHRKLLSEFELISV